MKSLAVALLVMIASAGTAAAGDGALVRHLNGFVTLGGGYMALPEGGGGGSVTSNVSPDGLPTDCREPRCWVVGDTTVAGAKPAEGGVLDLSGSLAFPLDYKSGIQLDAGGTLLNGLWMADGSFHLFWGEPDQGQFGPVLSYWTYDAASWLRTGGEVQGYWGDLTGYLQAGYQWGDSSQSLSVDDGFYACGRGTWYAVEDAALWAGGGYGPDDSLLGFVGAEARPFASGLPALSLVAEASLGNDDSWSAVAGLRYHFGAEVSLKERERAWVPLPSLPCDTLGVKSGRDGTHTVIWEIRPQ